MKQVIALLLAVGVSGVSFGQLPEPVVNFQLTALSPSTPWLASDGSIKHFESIDAAADFAAELQINGISAAEVVLPAPVLSATNDEDEWEIVTVIEYRIECINGVCTRVPVERTIKRLKSAAKKVVDASGDFVESTAERLSRARFLPRLRERFRMRRQGRLQSVQNFAATGVNPLANFFPRAWFNLR